MPTISAEKIVTALQRGTPNTRWRDFADVFLLSGHNPVSGHEIQQALAAVADYRQTDLIPLTDVLQGYALLPQTRWATWRRRQRLETDYPSRLPICSRPSSRSRTPRYVAKSPNKTGSPRLRHGFDGASVFETRPALSLFP